MATVTGLTADRMEEIENASVVDGDIVGDNLILSRKDGTTIDAGSVRGPQGVPGPPSTDVGVLAAIPVLEVGLLNQIRAGRQLTAADFTNMGLSLPQGLWNLTNLTDASGNGRSLTNKGGVNFGAGINGLAATAAKFGGFGSTALYIPDTGAADPFRILTGSFGCWTRTAKRVTTQSLISKEIAPGNVGQFAYELQIDNANLARAYVAANGVLVSVFGTSDVADDRWHFIVLSFDGGSLRLYVDGILEGQMQLSGVIDGGAWPLNIGSRYADAATAASVPHFGRVDEAFVTADILSEEEVRNLYCAKIPHALGVVPMRASINIHRRRKGVALVSADFPTQPLRLHNFTAGALTDLGSNNVPLTGVNNPTLTGGADGTSRNAFDFKGSANQNFSATDAGLPAALTSRSYGCWFRSGPNGGGIISWGTVNTNDARLTVVAASGIVRAASGADNLDGPYVIDSQWHFAVVVEDNGAGDAKRKLYIDGKLVNTSSVMNSITLAGAARFRIGSVSDGSSTFNGQIDEAFVTASVLTAEQIQALYLKSGQDLGRSPKNAGDHIELMDAASIFFIGDTLEPQNTVDLGVAA